MPSITNNATTSTATGVALVEDVTANCTYQSNNTSVATVTPGGMVQAVAPGATTVIITYTAIPGSANMSSTALAEGKKPITVKLTETVTVTR